jgi:TonB family protein
MHTHPLSSTANPLPFRESFTTKEKSMKKLATALIGLSIAATTVAQADEPASTAMALGAASVSTTQESRPLPGYPVSALRAGQRSGRVLLGYDVAADGTVTQVNVLSAYPSQVFTRASVGAVEKWRLAPGQAGSRKIELTFKAD